MTTLDVLQRSLMPFALNGDVKAAGRILDIMARRARYVPQLEDPPMSTEDESKPVTREEWGEKVDEWWKQFQLEQQAFDNDG